MMMACKPQRTTKVREEEEVAKREAQNNLICKHFFPFLSVLVPPRGGTVFGLLASAN